ncbi:glycoside hydrolase family 53 protein [Pseudocercospora fijiensis CIRAD86]|uniref:Arabinogalactan endo-beta-1,4-galactanase n=1 Tax=Pseudocercospora fijiensis (strain CIRAD86) TaxID=383855 RepID=M3B1D2_PSEFD|nr:glycoside hydrolase family 53 protein [Pseudocercospora fijiensis CIRAD86]EME83168.1 glycoside hydrolase family 53 protein [Pseudocercospora fijiensis CIRAD86]
MKWTSAALATFSASHLVHASPQPHKSFFYAGHDLSSLKILEDGGATYKDTAKGNATRQAEDILGDGGMNTVRLRLWVNPTTYDLDYITTVAKRFHEKGYKIYLDYHFSDYWADPQKQWQPTAWPTTLQPLASTLRKYVSDTLQHLHKANVDTAIVSLGNEIRHGMLWPLGRVNVDVEPESARIANFTGMATLYAAARSGVKDAVHAGVPKPLTMIHIDNGWNLTLQKRWFSALTATGKVKTSDWDVFGFSIYPFYGTNATLDNLKTSLNWVANQYCKPIHVVETDWPAICTGADAPELSEPSIPASVAGQLEWVGKVIDVVKQLPRGLGQGINYWEPAWLNNTGLGSSCQDAILFDSDWSQYPNVTAYSRKSVNMFRGAAESLLESVYKE